MKVRDRGNDCDNTTRMKKSRGRDAEHERKGDRERAGTKGQKDRRANREREVGKYSLSLVTILLHERTCKQ